MKVKRNKTIVLLLVLVLSSILLTGCVEQSVVISVNSSGKSDNAVLTIKVVADKEDYQKLDILGIEAPKNEDLYPNEVKGVNAFFRKIANIYNTQDMEITPIDDSFEVGFVAHKNFSSTQSLNSFIKHLNSENLIPFNGEISTKDLKVLQLYKAEGEIEYKLDEEIEELIKEVKENSELGNEEIEELINKSFETKAEVEFIFPGSIQYAEGYDEDSSAEDNPIFSNFLANEPKEVALNVRNVDKGRFAIFLTFLVVLVIIVLRAIGLKIIRKIRGR